MFFAIPTTTKLKGGDNDFKSMHVCIYACYSVAMKLRCQSNRYYDSGNIGLILTDFNNTSSRFYLVNSDFNRFHSFFTSITHYR